MIPLSIPDIRGPAAKKLYSSVKNNWVSSAGPDVKLFEASMKKFLNSKYAISTSSGSAAIYLALLALGIKAGVTLHDIALNSGVTTAVAGDPLFANDASKVNPNAGLGAFLLY